MASSISAMSISSRRACSSSTRRSKLNDILFSPLFYFEDILENVTTLGKYIPGDVSIALIIKEDTRRIRFVQEQTFDDLTITSPAAVDLTHGLALAFIGSQAGNVVENLSILKDDRVFAFRLFPHNVHLPVFPFRCCRFYEKKRKLPLKYFCSLRTKHPKKRNLLLFPYNTYTY